MTHTCTTCFAAPPFKGFDDCLSCAVAATLVEDPDYIRFANRVFVHDREWLKQFNAEWAKQSAALIASGFQRSVA